MIDYFCEGIFNRLRELRTKHIESLHRGSCPQTMEEYKYILGIIYGLEVAINSTQALFDEYLNKGSHKAEEAHYDSD